MVLDDKVRLLVEPGHRRYWDELGASLFIFLEGASIRVVPRFIRPFVGRVFLLSRYGLYM